MVDRRISGLKVWLNPPIALGTIAHKSKTPKPVKLTARWLRWCLQEIKAFEQEALATHGTLLESFPLSLKCHEEMGWVKTCKPFQNSYRPLTICSPKALTLPNNSN